MRQYEERRTQLARTLVITAVIGLLLSAANWVQGVKVIAAVTVPVALACIGLSYAARRAKTQDDIVRVVRMFCALVGILLVYVGYVGGGALANGTNYLILLPLFAAFYLTRREAMGWLIVVMVLIVGVAFVHHFFPTANLRPATPVRATIDKLGLIAMIVFIVMAIRQETDATKAQLELEQANLRNKGEALAEARDQALQLANAKSQFLANMSHEIRTPLNGVIGMTDILLQEDLESEALRCADTISKSGKTLLAVVNDILDFSKLESNNLSIDHNPMSPRTVVADVLELFGHTCGTKGIELAQDITDAVPRSILGDANRLRQVLINLVGNAVKFTKRGSVLLKVAIVNERIVFEVKDTGVGIPSTEIDRLFSEFSQLDPSTTREFGGTGLGLAISQRLVSLMGGTLSATSVINEGSAFTFELPLKRQQSPTNHDVSHETVTVALVGLTAMTERAVRQVAGQLGVQTISRSVDRITEADDSSVDLWLVSASLGEQLTPVTATIAKAYPKTVRLLLVSAGTSHPSLASLHLLGKVYQPLSEHALADAIKSWCSDIDTDFHEHSIDDEESIETACSLEILVAEDNQVNQIVVRRMLELLGHRVTMAANGIEAVDAVRSTSYDLVLMDVHMPHMDGLEATRRIRALDIKTDIVALTASVLDEQRQECERAGMSGFLTKPVQIRAMKELLRGLGGSLDSPAPK